MAEENQLSIDQGEDKEFNVYLVDSKGRPIDVTDYDKSTISMPSSAESTPNVQLTEVDNPNGSSFKKVAPYTSGKFACVINRLDSVALKSGSNQDVYVQIEDTVAAVRKRIKIPGILNVEETPLPNP